MHGELNDLLLVCKVSSTFVLCYVSYSSDSAKGSDEETGGAGSDGGGRVEGVLVLWMGGAGSAGGGGIGAVLDLTIGGACSMGGGGGATVFDRTGGAARGGKGASAGRERRTREG